jgi:DNA-binding XRE family transcriptional regulator
METGKRPVTPKGLVRITPYLRLGATEYRDLYEGAALEYLGFRGWDTDYLTDMFGPPAPQQDSLGSIIRRYRGAHSITQRDLASKLGISRIYLIALENDRQRPSYRLLEGIGDSLDVDPVSLYAALYRQSSSRGASDGT